jgi:hypothetical protein
MGRIIGGSWLLDVPIKHHALGLLRGAARHQLAEVRDPRPLRTGTTAEPFWNFQLAAVRGLLWRCGWQTRVVASVNNLRRWDRSLPRPLVRALRPLAQATEAAAQRGGCGWWGPSQFVLARRTSQSTARPAFPPAPEGAPAPGDSPVFPPAPEGAPALAGRMVCPACRGALAWAPSAATCTQCARGYRKNAQTWDFTLTRSEDASGAAA